VNATDISGIHQLVCSTTSDCAGAQPKDRVRGGLKQRLLNLAKDTGKTQERLKKAWRNQTKAAAHSNYLHALAQHSVCLMQQAPQQQLEHLAAQLAEAKEQLQAANAEVVAAEAAAQHHQDMYLEIKTRIMRKEGRSEAAIEAFIKANATFCLSKHG
jgi:tetratricopeptide (TPR) repeat protein